MPASHGVVGYAASESWPEVLLGHSERQHHRREGTERRILVVGPTRV